LQEDAIKRLQPALSVFDRLRADIARSGWYEFTPLGVCLVRSLRPRRIIEVGRAISELYLAFCETVRLSNLNTECICRLVQSELRVSSEIEEELRHGENNAYHHKRYASFSTIEPTTNRFSTRTDSQSFDLIHISNPRSSDELVELCSSWWPRLSPTGIGLVSGFGKFSESTLRSGFFRISLDCFRVFQMDHWLGITSFGHPVGVARDLLFSSPTDLDRIVSLFQLIAGYVAWQSKPLAYEVDQLRTDLETSRSSELDAQIRFGRTDLRLLMAWAEKEKLTAQLQQSQGEIKHLPVYKHLNEGEERQQRDSVNSERCTPHTLAAKDALSNMEGRDLWNASGRSLVGTILSGGHRLAFPNFSSPLVSIIVVVRNNIHLSALCLASLLENAGSGYEVIVVDNGSSDETSRVLFLTANVMVIRNEDNRGFGPACMQGVGRASGSFLCFLNNDALIEAGSLSAAVQDCVEDPRIGAVGGKILNANGTLQEAGCIVWRDGRTHQYGRGDDPNLPQYAFRRSVDYCSGVFLVTPRKAFEELGGFDARYAPAYYEDVDYCMKAWASGRKVIYEPRSTVVHYENASSSDRATALEKVIVNHENFTSRWHSELAMHEVERTENVFKGRIAAHARAKKVLYFLGKLPTSMGPGEDARFALVASSVKARSQVTCVFTTNDDRPLERSKYFPIDVELLNLGQTSVSVFKDHFETTDEVIVATGYELDAQISELLQKYAVKITAVRRNFRGERASDLK
jgi:GT2 family glycosyltransferase